MIHVVPCLRELNPTVEAAWYDTALTDSDFVLTGWAGTYRPLLKNIQSRITRPGDGAAHVAVDRLRDAEPD